MALDVWIFGPGFGESVLLVWEEYRKDTNVREKRAAFFDSYSGRTIASHASLCEWNRQGQPDVALVAISHPHLDHVKGAAMILRAIEAKAAPARVLWWGGVDLRHLRGVYDHISTVTNGEQGETARMTTDFLDTLVRIQDGDYAPLKVPRPVVDTCHEFTQVYSTDTIDGPLRISTFSPWTQPRTPYVNWAVSAVRQHPTKGMANCTSAGFVIECGQAQILLGGDVEQANWNAYCEHRKAKAGAAAALRPCLS